MIWPTRRLVVVSALGIPVAVVAILVNRDLWVIPIAYQVALMIVAMVDARSGLLASIVEVESTAPKILYIGESGSLTLRCRAGRRGVGVGVEVLLDANDVIVPPTSRLFEFDYQGEAIIEISLVPRRRGILELDRLWLRWQGPFGLIWHSRDDPLAVKVRVIANIRSVKRHAIRLAHDSQTYGNKLQGSRGIGSEFDAMRAYQTGMDYRSIDWKHSARHRTLVSKEYRDERNHNIVLAIDTGHLMREPIDGISKLDRAINAGLILAYQALAVGDRVGFFAFDEVVRGYRAPRPGMQEFGAIQAALSELDYYAEETNFTLGMTQLLARLNRRALIVVLTDFVDTITADMMIRNIRFATKRHLVLFLTLYDISLRHAVNVEPSSIEDLARSIVASEIEHDRLIVLDKLKKLGVHVVDVLPSQIDSALVDHYTSIKRQALI